jgi:hypothetical protein
VAAQRKEISMNNPYDDLHSMSKLYREQALLDARTRHLEGRLRAERRPADPGRKLADLARGALVSLLSSAGLAAKTAEPSGEEQR